MRCLLFFVLSGLIASTAFARGPADPMNAVAEKYARLVLALGQHDPDYVDAFYGPAEWKTVAEREKKPLDLIGTEAAELLKLMVDRTATARPLVDSRSGAKTSHSDAATTPTNKSGSDMDCCAVGTEDGDLPRLRREYLQKQISSLAARVRMLKGEKLKFDDESRALYDAVAPTFSDSHFEQIIAQLESKIPGASRTGSSLWQRYEEWRKPFVIPKEK